MTEKTSKKKILVIDDEEDFTKLIKLNLEQTGEFEVKTENSATEGIATAKQFKPDLIFLDILMPDMKGDELAYELKADEVTKDIPIVFLTALVTKEQVKEGHGFIGGRPFIAKPVNVEELAAYINKYA